jgi:hypothetical protein
MLYGSSPLAQPIDQIFNSPSFLFLTIVGMSEVSRILKTSLSLKNLEIVTMRILER